MWGLINVCKDLVDHPPEMLHLCCVILTHCKKFSLNLFSPSNDLLKPRKYYCKWLRALFNMDYMFFGASDVRTCVTWRPNLLPLWCFLNGYHRLSSPAWIAGWHLEMRIQISGSTDLWIWAHSVRAGLRKPWMRKDVFSTPDASRLSVFSQGVLENRKFSLMGRTLIDITDILWNYLNYLWWQNHCLYCAHKMKARKEIWSTVVPIRHNCHLFLEIFFKLKPTRSLSYIYISPCMAQWTN